MMSIGVPYKQADVDHAVADAKEQGAQVAKDLAGEGVKVEPDREIVAVIAYLQRLGAKPAPPKAPMPVAEASQPSGNSDEKGGAL
jgi:cytochrome c oxidase cbb3-type subunit I/II